jgi:hypothetical protein
VVQITSQLAPQSSLSDGEDPNTMNRPGHSAQKLDRATQRRIAVVAALVVFGAFVVLAGLGAGVRVVSCDTCHSMRSYAEAHVDTAHAALTCAECHTGSGAAGLFSDGARAVRWIVREPFVEDPAPIAVSDSACRTCHDAVLTETVVGSVRVRHSDFEDTACGECHGGTAHPVDGRWHLGPQMEDCLSCHRVSLNNIDVCETCHSSDAREASRERPSAWRASHGPGWEQAHGMGDLSGCTACHAPAACERCHGVGLPHPPTWEREHGRDLAEDQRAACSTCHLESWCTDCHGVEMPHPAGFLPDHGSVAEAAGETACSNCHVSDQCSSCHFYSSHPNVLVPGSHGSGVE